MSIGPWQIALVLVIILIIFGAGKLPGVMGDLAKGVKTFKKGLEDKPKPTKRIAKSGKKRRPDNKKI